MTGLPTTPLTHLGSLAHLATLGTSLARLLADVDYQTDADTAAAITAALAPLRAASRDDIGEAVIVLTALLDDRAAPLLADVPLTVPQAATILGLSRKTVWAAIRDGQLVATQVGAGVGGEWRISLADLRAYHATPRPPVGRPRKEAPKPQGEHV